ncbi:MAG: 4Fe-4S ferredoxin, partial [Thermodesulfobacteriota bacterium]
MIKPEDHPIVKRYNQKPRPKSSKPQPKLDSEWLRNLCLEAGADDVGFVEIDRPEIDKDRKDI